MSQYVILLIGNAFAFVLLLLQIVFWRRFRVTERQLERLSAALQRQERAIAQQRYALAAIRQIKAGTEAEGEDIQQEANDLDKAFAQASEDVAAAPEVEQAPAELTQTVQKNKTLAALGHLKEAEILQFLQKAVKNNQISVMMQPIVNLPQREPKFFEMFSRIEVAGEGYISAGQFISVARSNNLMAAIDHLLLLRCLQILKQSAQAESPHGFFVNIAAQTLNSTKYLKGLIEFLQANPKLSSRLIFEMTQSDSLQLNAEAKRVMEALSLLGCRFSMDQVKIFGIDIDRLVDCNIGFVKLDANAMSKDAKDSESHRRFKKIKNLLDAQGIQVILEKVEHERQILNVLDLNIDYGQGYLFAAPQPVA